VPREVVALVSADDAVAAVRVHADRVHDLLRRTGVGADESIEVCESYAFGLLDALVNAPEAVGDMAGWWFGRALELSRRLGPAEDAVEDAPTSVLSGTAGEAEVRAALARLPEAERCALMLRDAYDLPPQAVPVALGRSEPGAAGLVAGARLHLLEIVDGRPPPSLAGHVARTPADLTGLSRLADGTLPAQAAVALQRHVRGCNACDDVMAALAKARRLCAGLPVIAMPDDAREAMLERIAERAAVTLPSVDEVLTAIDQDDDGGPLVSPVIAAFLIVLALVLGVALAVVSTDRTQGTPLGAPIPSSAPPEQPSFSVSPSPHRHRSATPTATPTSQTPTSTPTDASPTATTTPRHTTPPTHAVITLTPPSGPRGTQVTVSGRGWAPGATVLVRYTGALSNGSTTPATVDAHGRFSVTVTANGTLPGSYTVTAQSGSQSASAQFRQTS
jgi:hypothetical protein